MLMLRPVNANGLGTDVWSVPFDNITTLLKVKHNASHRHVVADSSDILLGRGRLLGSATSGEDLSALDISSLLPR